MKLPNRILPTLQPSQPAAPRPGWVDYRFTPVRVEWRPVYGLHSREELCRALDVLEEAGIRAWWYGAAAKGAYPLFASRQLPHRDDADDDLLRWLTEESHRRGMTVFSWAYLATAPMLLAEHPGWRVHPIGGGEVATSGEPHRYACYNSPYGQRLKGYCVEVVNDLGFDGLWFDGSGLHLPGGRLGCVCPACTAKYEETTGEPPPDRAHLEDPAFRRFVRWRYDDFMDYWRQLTDFVREHAPDALLVFNHFNRLNNPGWSSGCPLARHRADAMAATECDSQRSQLVFQHKLLQAVNGDGRPTEVWSALLDGAHVNYPNRPEPDPTAALHHVQASAAAGGFASFGIGAHPADYRYALERIAHAADAVTPYVGGQHLACVGLVVSQQTLDFSSRPAFDTWRSIHGTHWLLQALHWPSDPLLDDDLGAEDLGRYGLVVLPATACLGAEQVAAIRSYVEAGGTLLALGDCGTRDESGYVETGASAFDQLAGIARRHERCGPVIVTQAPPTWRQVGLPERFMLAGEGRLVDPTDDAAMMAAASMPLDTSARRFDAQGMIRQAVESCSGAAVFQRRVGLGRVVTVVTDTGHAYARNNHHRSRELVRLLVGDAVQSVVHIDAPPMVHAEPWQQGDRLVVHLLNTPSVMTHLRVTNEHEERPFWPEDVTPTGPVTLTAPAGYRRAHAPQPQDTSTTITHTRDRLSITLPHMDRHAVVVFE